MNCLLDLNSCVQSMALALVLRVSGSLPSGRVGHLGVADLESFAFREMLRTGKTAPDIVGARLWVHGHHDGSSLQQLEGQERQSSDQTRDQKSEAKRTII